MNEETILYSVKSFIGLEEDYNPFDSQLITILNSVFLMLSQIGVIDFANRIVKSDTTWDEFDISEDSFGLIRHYVCLKTKYLFDTPTSSTLSDVYSKELAELEWRINAAVDSGRNTESTTTD